MTTYTGRETKIERTLKILKSRTKLWTVARKVTQYVTFWSIN